MTSGYKVFWTDTALVELDETFEYLEHRWSKKELKNLANEIEQIIELISRSPEIFPESIKKSGIRKALVTSHNTIYFRTKGKSIEVLSFFSNRKNPDSLKTD